MKTSKFQLHIIGYTGILCDSCEEGYAKVSNT